MSRTTRIRASLATIACAAGLGMGAAQATTGTTRAPLHPTSLERPRSEAPLLAPRAAETCPACHLARETTGRIDPSSVRLESRRLDNGVALRFTSSDPTVREQLWKATLARGELVDALRTGTDVHLCEACRIRRELLADLQVAAQRVPEGVIVVYTSTRPEVVRDIVHLLEDAGPKTAQF